MTNKLFLALTSVSALFPSTGLGAARDDDRAHAHSLRELIAEQVGGLDKLKVPRYQTTEAKRHLGDFGWILRTAACSPRNRRRPAAPATCAKRPGEPVRCSISMW